MTRPSLLLPLIFYSMSCSALAPTVRLNDGSDMPAIALGTFLGIDKNGVLKSGDRHYRDVICEAIDAGYRHFDTAPVYNTEAMIGEAIRMKIEQGAIKREDVFVTTKLWSTHHQKSQVVDALRNQLKILGLDYVDLYLIHWPMGFNEDYTNSDVDYLETWRGMEAALDLGLVKHIGVSNFNRQQLERLIRYSSVIPAVLQIEVHLQMVQADLVEYAQSNGIVVMAFSPFGSLVKRYGIQFPGPRLDDPLIGAIAKKYGKTTSQVALRWLVDRKIVPIPKTINATRFRENIDIFDFKLTEEEIQTISSFNTDTRYTLPSFWQDHPYYPFEKIEKPIDNPFFKNK